MRNIEQDFHNLSNKLERHHAVFYHLWKMGKPSFSTEIETAAVQFDDKGKFVKFLFNEKFYNSLSDYDLEFVVCHEILHVILNHGSRLRRVFNNVSNIAMDVVVNHSLLDYFGFDRSKLQIKVPICWLDTVFKDKVVLSDQSCEYYYEQLSQDLPPTLKSLDDHSWLSKSDWSDVLDQLNEQLTDVEKESIKEVLKKHSGENLSKGQLAGTEALGHWTFVSVKNVKPKKKWETVIKRWASPYLEDFKSMEQWARLNRRYSAMDFNCFIPSEMEDLQIDEPKKIDVTFFLDTSGSCWNLKDRFFAAALSLPKWRFNLDLCCFDCKVYQTDLESRKVAGGGGTSFSILEDHIQDKLRRGIYKKYPFVFVITDGAGNAISPAIPENWYWFLTGTFVRYIPSSSKTFSLSNYE